MTETARSSKTSVTTQTKRCHNCQNLAHTFFTASQPCSLLRGHTEYFDSHSFPPHFNKFWKIVLASNRREFLVLTQWSVTLCSLVDRKKCLCYFHFQRMAASSSETFVSVLQCEGPHPTKPLSRNAMAPQTRTQSRELQGPEF
jgi:hypothetical protein